MKYISNSFLIMIIISTILISSNQYMTSLKIHPDYNISPSAEIPIEINSNSIGGLRNIINYDFEFSSKFLYIKNEKDFTDNISKFNKINSEWILLIDILQTYNQVLKYVSLSNPMIYQEESQKKPIRFNINSIIINTNSITSNEKISINKEYPSDKTLLAYVNDDLFQKLIKKSIDYEEDNWFLSINIKISNIQLQKTISQYILLGLFVISVLVLCLLKVKYNQSNQSFLIVFNLLLKLSFILSLLLLIYTISMIIYGGSDDSLFGDYIFIFTNVIFCVFKALLWFISFLISYGWHVYAVFTRRESKWVMIIFVIIYIYIVIDVIIIELKSYELWNGISISDIKSIVLYIFFGGYSIFCSLRGVIMLKRKLQESIQFESIYMIHLSQKIKQMYIHIVSLTIFITFSIASILIFKFILYGDLTQDTQLLFDIAPYYIGMYLLIYSHLPNEILILFEIVFTYDNVSSERKLNLFGCFIKNENILNNNSQKLTLNTLESIDKSNPIVVLNPIQVNDENVINSNNDLTKCAIICNCMIGKVCE